MKKLVIELPDELYESAERRAAERGSSLPDEVVSLIERFTSTENGDHVAAARLRMQELFRTIRGFPVTVKIPREELYERGRVR